MEDMAAVYCSDTIYWATLLSDSFKKFKIGNILFLA